ncbi:30S ribosomal protein S16 [Candidatus Kapabacteria bacterium]|nr:30S ribosomal protein S16 [Candidatus Kapabacteria bacterium]
MVKLRLRRKGRIHLPVYDVVAVDERKKRDGKYIERLGYFDPNQTPSTIKINHDRAIYWLNNGAQPTKTVRNLLSYDGILLRRALGFKEKSTEEIDEQIAKHKEVVKARFFRRKEHRIEKSKKVDEPVAEEETAPAAEEAATPTEETAEA